MDVEVAAKALNVKAAQQKWHHFCDPSLSFSHSSHDHLFRVWKQKAAGRPMPARNDMTLRDLKDVLRNIVIFERVAEKPSHYRWRLIGTSLTDVLGHNTGKMLEDSVPSELLPRWLECGDLILDGGKPLRFLGRVHLQGREYLHAEHLYVPLANEQGVPTFVMGLCRYTPRTSDSEDNWENEIASIPGSLL
ncbi:MAG: hypothetical protein JWP16_2030 [Alphaproteobacteria bacterium]|nr:hypothetical protein [Alphaproteobacteria bacterium]MDB5740990.1 hypothetical protein [Alphaproteobacteria bacterium]